MLGGRYGLYVALLSLLIGFKDKTPQLPPWGQWAGIVCFLAGAVAAGVIAGNIPLYNDWKRFDSEEFGPYGKEWLTFRQWAAIEHTAFWIGVGAIIASVALQ
jgi:hypothetical protein